MRRRPFPAPSGASGVVGLAGECHFRRLRCAAAAASSERPGLTSQLLFPFSLQA